MNVEQEFVQQKERKFHLSFLNRILFVFTIFRMFSVFFKLQYMRNSVISVNNLQLSLATLCLGY